MSTQTIVIGQPCKTKKLVPIKFNQLLNLYLKFIPNNGYLSTDFKFIELICKHYCSTPEDGWQDLMFVYDDPTDRESGVLLVGKWNDGVVE